MGGDKGYDTQNFIEHCWEMKVTPHVEHNTERLGGSALDGQTTRRARLHTISLHKHKLIETTFGWAKHYGGLRRMINRELENISARVSFTVTVFNLLRIGHLVPQAAL